MSTCPFFCDSKMGVKRRRNSIHFCRLVAFFQKRSTPPPPPPPSCTTRFEEGDLSLFPLFRARFALQFLSSTRWGRRKDNLCSFFYRKETIYLFSRKTRAAKKKERKPARARTSERERERRLVVKRRLFSIRIEQHSSSRERERVRFFPGEKKKASFGRA